MTADRRHTLLESFAFPPGIREVPFLAQIGLRADPHDAAQMDGLARAIGDSLPMTPNTVSGAAGMHVLWLGPDEWLAVGEPGAEAGLEARCRAALGAGTGAVVDVSANRTTIELWGAAAREVLASGCAIDLHPRAFGSGRCAQTLIARAGVILHQFTDEPRYRLYVRPSFARYLAEWLTDTRHGMAPPQTQDE